MRYLVCGRIKHQEPLNELNEEKSYLKIAQEKVKENKFELSHHAQMERGEEKIGVDDIANAILTGQELEPYPEDSRGESCLFCGKGDDERWIHVLCGNFDHDNLLIITVYIPKKPKWKDPFTRGGA